VSEGSWTSEEIKTLRSENGGGNKAANSKWYGKFDDDAGRKPMPGDSMETYRRFIRKVYVQK
jgi:hypothetical protein